MTYDPTDTRQELTLRLRLLGIKPMIWRRLAVSNQLDLADLHDVIQVAMGWEMEHLHAYRRWYPAGGSRAELPLVPNYEAEELGRAGLKRRGLRSEADIQLSELFQRVGDKLEYTYDFGDSWEHVLRLEKIKPWDPDQPNARVLGGERACPPEDCGGVWGYLELLDRLKDRPVRAIEPGDDAYDEDEDEDGEDEWDWLVSSDFDPEHFDLAKVNRILAKY
ncbi:MAG: plasmid pRiA4b ORF-3 family protein [Bifidobacteriaceae bacterium]|jgi:hypothetical protein|nr:plasmid pRiA4b ORF-3 family protein [Bifidobacteriaceae bacterium]